MSGKAIVLTGADFSALNLGKVVFADENMSIPVTSISVESDKASIQVGEIANLVASVLPIDATNSNVLWTTSSNAIATVAPSGKTCVVTAIAPGTVTVTCTSASNTNIRFTTQIVVTDILITGITISGPTEIINNGKYAAAYSPINTTQKGIVWSSSNTSIATIDSAGNLTVVSNGAVTITARSAVNASVYGTFDVACELAVVPVSSIVLSAVGSPTTLNVNESLSISALVSPETASNKALIWSVNNSHAEIVSSNDDGCVVKGLTSGAVAITATSADDGSKVGTYNLTVQVVLVSAVTLTPSTTTIRVGDSIFVSAVMTPSNATNKAITWAANNANVSIEVNGDACTVIGVTEGDFIITATASDAGGVIGTWAGTVQAAAQVDNTLLVHLESEDYVPSTESWLCRKSGLSAYVFGNPAKSANGLTFSQTARYKRYSLDIASLYHGGSFTLYLEGTFTYFATNSPSNRISGIQYLSGNSNYGIWALTRGATEGLGISNIGGSYYSSNDATVLHKCVIVFDVPEERTTIYGLNGSAVIINKYKDLTGTLPTYHDPFVAFTNASTFWLSNGSIIGTGDVGSSADVTNQHTLKTIKLFNVAKTLAEVTAMLTA